LGGPAALTPTGRIVQQSLITAADDYVFENCIFTAVDVETTGLSPARDGIIEVGACRIEGGAIVRRLSLLIRRDEPLPPRISRLTGLRDEDLRSGVELAEALQALYDFARDTVWVLHHARFDLGFLNSAGARAGLPIVAPPVIDTLLVADRLLPPGLRRSLDALCRHLGVPLTIRHRALPDAELTAQLWLQLQANLAQQGVRSFHELRVLLGTGRRLRGLREPQRRQLVLYGNLQRVPQKPGVYLMRDETGEVIYIGKSTALRRRLGSYFGKGRDEKAARLMRRVHSIEFIEVGSELEALLLESRLIKQYLPQFNVAGRSYRNYPFLRVRRDVDFPYLEVTREVLNDGSAYYGPFRSVRLLEECVDAVCKVVPLRRCTGPLDRLTDQEKQACFWRRLGRCSAPCLERIDRAHYAELVRQACELLEGRGDAVLSEIIRRRDAAAEELNFERAAWYRDLARALVHFREQHRLFRSAVEELNLLAILPAVDVTQVQFYLFLRGRLRAQLQAAVPLDDASRRALAALLHEHCAAMPAERTMESMRISAAELDEINICHTWLEKHSPVYVSLPGGALSPEEISEVVRLAAAVAS
jgi:DNA polymerase-3 subunit epsilon